MIGIYVITHRASGRAYVGSSTDIDRRFSEHLCQLKSGTHHNHRLQEAWTRDGKDAFVFSVVEVLDFHEKLIEREQHHADSHDDTYNVGKFIDNPFRGEKLSAEVRAKMSAHAKIRKYSAETRAKFAAAKLGKKRPPFTDVHRARMSAVKKATWKSRVVPLSHTSTHTLEAKAKMSASQKAAWIRRKAANA